MRSINQDLLRKKIRSEKFGRKKLALAIHRSVNTVNNWLRPDWPWGLDEDSAKQVATYYGVSINKLFPPVGAGGRAS